MNNGNSRLRDFFVLFSSSLNFTDDVHRLYYKKKKYEHLPK